MSTELDESIRVIIVGDSGVGKTTFIKRHYTGEFEWLHVPTTKGEWIRFPFHTNIGRVVCQVLDTPGANSTLDERKAMYDSAHCAIIMFDVTSKKSYQSVPKWYSELSQASHSMPIVLCGNKVDNKLRQVRCDQINFHTRHDIGYYDISAKSNFNYESPFVYLMSKVLGQEVIMCQPVCCHINCDPIDPELMRLYEEELLNAQSICNLPDYDDDL